MYAPEEMPVECFLKPREDNRDHDIAENGEKSRAVSRIKKNMAGEQGTKRGSRKQATRPQQIGVKIVTESFICLILLKFRNQPHLIPTFPRMAHNCLIC